MTGSQKLFSNLLRHFCRASSSRRIAAETRRRARLVELDPKYVDVIVRRWQEFTGKKATLAATGQSFEELLKERVV